MGIFDFEASFTKAVSEVQTKGVRKHYANIQTNEVVCVLDTFNNIIYDTDNNIMEDQSRFHYLIDMDAITEVKSLAVNEGIKLSDFERGSYLHEGKASYIVYIGNPAGTDKLFLSKSGDLLYAIPGDNPNMKIKGDDLYNRYNNSGDKIWPEVKKFDGANTTEIADKLEKKVGLSFSVKTIAEV